VLQVQAVQGALHMHIAAGLLPAGAVGGCPWACCCVGLLLGGCRCGEAGALSGLGSRGECDDGGAATAATSGATSVAASEFAGIWGAPSSMAANANAAAGVAQQWGGVCVCQPEGPQTLDLSQRWAAGWVVVLSFEVLKQSQVSGGAWSKVSTLSTQPFTSRPV
jgi:hypothetical protein